MTLTNKILFNSNTLKAFWNPSTSNAQMFTCRDDVCPDSVIVNLSGIVDCSCGTPWPSDVNALGDITVIYDGPGSRDCQYSYTEPGYTSNNGWKISYGVDFGCPLEPQNLIVTYLRAIMPRIFYAFYKTNNSDNPIPNGMSGSGGCCGAWQLGSKAGYDGEGVISRRYS